LLLQANGELEYLYYLLLAVGIVLAIRYSSDRSFEVTPLDYLVVLLVMALALLSQGGYANPVLVRMVVQMIILFYAAESRNQAHEKPLECIYVFGAGCAGDFEYQGRALGR